MLLMLILTNCTYHCRNKQVTCKHKEDVQPFFVVPTIEPHDAPEGVQEHKARGQEGWGERNTIVSATIFNSLRVLNSHFKSLALPPTFNGQAVPKQSTLYEGCRSCLKAVPTILTMIAEIQ